MTIGILQDIIERIRELSASGNSQQVTDEKIIKYINSYYLNRLPSELRVLHLKDVYTFNTIQGVAVYPFNYDEWTTVGLPCYIGKTEMVFFQHPEDFYGYDAERQFTEVFTTSDGSSGPFSGNTLNFPMLKSTSNNPIADTQISPTGIFPANYPASFDANNISRIQNILISANTATSSLVITDDGVGNLIGDVAAGGTIDYQTGAISNVNFTLAGIATAIPSGNDITVKYVPVTLGQPLKLLFSQNQFIVRPVPDQAYQIELTAYRKPSTALLGTTSSTAPTLTGRPEDFAWWELIAFGVSKMLYQDRLDTDGVQVMEAFLQDAIDDALTKTYAQLSKQQISTIYRNETNQQNILGGFR